MKLDMRVSNCRRRSERCGMHAIGVAAALVPPPVMTFTPGDAAAEAAAEAYSRYQRLVAQLAPLAMSPWCATT